MDYNFPTSRESQSFTRTTSDSVSLSRDKEARINLVASALPCCSPLRLLQLPCWLYLLLLPVGDKCILQIHNRHNIRPPLLRKSRSSSLKLNVSSMDNDYDTDYYSAHAVRCSRAACHQHQQSLALSAPSGSPSCLLGPPPHSLTLAGFSRYNFCFTAQPLIPASYIRIRSGHLLK